MKNKRLLESLSFIDDKYVLEAEPKTKKRTRANASTKTIKRVACLAIILVLSLYLFIPITDKGPKLTAYEDSEYFPIIEKIADYRYKPNSYKNNFQALTSGFLSIFRLFGAAGMAPGDGAAADRDNASSAPSNGQYDETTDNQVAGVIEADLVKRTDKYVFRLGSDGGSAIDALKVYSIDAENSELVATFIIPGFADEKSGRYQERVMYLSNDANTVTIISPYYDQDYKSRVRIISIDVSNINNIKMNKTISIDGYYNSSRMVDGKLVFISQYTVKTGDIDYNNPETFVPSITDGEKSSIIKFEDILYPNKVGSTRYSVVALIDESTLELHKAYALLDFFEDIYVSESNVYVTKEYSAKETLDDEGSYVAKNMVDIAVLGYENETLIKKGVLTAEGSVLDQYSMDEYDGHFRVVTSIREQTISKNYDTVSSGTIVNASLTVFNLESFEKVGEVRSFAPQGESVSSVRFDGTAAYVCTAIVQTFTDPVFFFDLTDYSNITYTDTGVIDGFSSSLIQLGDGYLLGIGEENWQYGKVEVYEQIADRVLSVDAYNFVGTYSLDYKAYFINRENNLFGFAVSDYSDGESYYRKSVYILLRFNGYELIEVTVVDLDVRYPDRIRAFIKDDYLYITSDSSLLVVNTKEQ